MALPLVRLLREAYTCLGTFNLAFDETVHIVMSIYSCVYSRASAGETNGKTALFGRAETMSAAIS